MNRQTRADGSLCSGKDSTSGHNAGPAEAHASPGRNFPVKAADEQSGAGTDGDGYLHTVEAATATSVQDSAQTLVGQSPEDTGGGTSFGTTLEPVLRRACDGRLSAVNWFRTDWQRGGALTGTATYTDDRGIAREVVVKLPVPPCEQQWLAALQSYASAGEAAGKDDAGDEIDEPLVPRLYAHGSVLNGYDLAWVAMEHLPHGPLGSGWGGKEFDLLIAAVVRFYAAGADFPLTGEPMRRDWNQLLDKSRQAVRDKAMPEPQRWSKALKKAQRKFKQWVDLWEDRPIDGWCHGDLHLANALSREPAPAGPAVLIDFARARIGHWLEDAIYFEHLYWARSQRLHGRKLTRQIAHERKRLGLPVEKDWARRAEARRALLAATTCAHLRFDGDPRHLAAALEVLERIVN